MKISTLSAGLLLRVAAMALVVCLVGGCDRESSPHTHEEINQLQTDLEQLANQVGRLEFRIYELENHHASQPAADGAATESDAKIDSTVKTSAGKGRIDLTPVEP